MISDPNLIFYACIARERVILAEFSREPSLEVLAAQCIENAPQHHSIYSETVRDRSYTFLIEGPYVFFAIYDEKLGKTEGLFFLNRVKCAFEELTENGSIKNLNGSAPRCLQGPLEPIFRELLAPDTDLGPSPRKDGHDASVDSSKGRKASVAPLLGKPCKASKKKKKPNGGAADGNVRGIKTDAGEDGHCVCKEFLVSLFSGRGSYVNDMQKAKRAWRKYVLVVVLLDLFVCATLFAIWLWICRGFKCIND